MLIHWVHVCRRNPLVTPRSCIIVQAKSSAITARSRAHSWPRRWQAPVHWTAITWHLICGRNWWFANRKIASRTLPWVRKAYGTRWQNDPDETPTLQLPMVQFLELHPWPALWGHRPLCSIWMVLDLKLTECTHPMHIENAAVLKSKCYVKICPATTFIQTPCVSHRLILSDSFFHIALLKKHRDWAERRMSSAYFSQLSASLTSGARSSLRTGGDRSPISELHI